MKGLKTATAVVPSLFTVGNMALGFYAIMQAFQGNWIAAPTAIFIAHVLDILDGRLARWMGATSDFGGEFDSFADWISFGIAPAIMVYLLALRDYGKFGFLLAFLYVLCGALRLARFNLKSGKPNEAPSTSFQGLPIPGAGGFIAVLVLLFGLWQTDHQGKTMWLIYNQIPLLRQAIPLIVFGLSMLMISKVPYSTFKKTHLFRPQSLRPFMIMVFVCFMIYAYPQNTIFIIYLTYIMWGIVMMFWRAYVLRHGPAHTPQS
jgi:CDP-diacylglycerol--serine O-phosphatidyltransferase